MELTQHRREAGRLHAVLWWGEAYDSGPHLDIDVGSTGAWRNVSAHLTFGGEDRDIGASLGLGWASIYVSVGGILGRWRRGSYDRANARAERLNAAEPGRHLYGYMLDPFDGRDTSVRVFDGSVWVNVWKSDHGWTSGDTRRLPWNGLGWDWTFHVQDWLIGPAVYEVDPEQEPPIAGVVEMPEGCYSCIVKVERVRWNRRWWNGRWSYRGSVEVPSGIPYAGKGENSYDLDDDATYAITFACEDCPGHPTDYTRRLALDVLKTRSKRGSLRWAPAGGWPVPVAAV